MSRSALGWSLLKIRHPLKTRRPARMFSTSRGLDSFDQYLQDVEKYPLIQDPAEETGSSAAGPIRGQRSR